MKRRIWSLPKLPKLFSSDKTTCKSIENNDQASGSIVINACKSTEICISNNEIRKIDSLFRHFMRFYIFISDYSFVVIEPIPFQA